VTSLKAFGVFVELSPGRDGMVHLSELDTGFVAEPSAVVKVGPPVLYAQQA
jgi:predicted RNA-binding protein with RPS1 domain